jgi:ELWxxDGT repeat protein
MPAKRSLTLALALLLVAAIPVRGVTPPTIQLIDLRPMADSSSPGDLVLFAGKIFFAADDGTHGRELWRTDGAPDATHTGTELVCDLFTAPGFGSSPYNLTVLGDWLYFSADPGIARNALYRTNGAIDGCEEVTTAPTIENVEYPRVLGDQLWFSAVSTDGVEPWMTTSTGAPAQVANINPTGSSNPAGFTKLGSYVYFNADNGTDGYELWKSNGTGATMAANINETPGEGSNPQELFASSAYDILLFRAYSPTVGWELFGTDGVDVEAFDINVGVDNSDPGQFTEINGTIYFTAFTDETGMELWSLNETDGLELVSDIYPGTSSSSPQQLRAIGNWLYFTANAGAFGYELWRTNGTTTEMVIDILPGSDGAYPFGFVEHDGVIFFSANNGSDWTLFQTTGTAASTVEAVTTTGTSPYAGCECYTPIIFLGDRAFTYMGNAEYGYEVAFFDPLLPSTNRNGSGLPLMLIMGAALTAAASVSLRLRTNQ